MSLVWQSVISFVRRFSHGEYGLPHQRARWFAMTGIFDMGVRCGCGSSGKSPKRRRWRKKRGGFEEVPRLTATTVDGNRLARRWAIAEPYAVQENFHKLSFRGAQRRGNPYSSYDRGAVQGEYGLPRQFENWLAMTGFFAQGGAGIAREDAGTSPYGYLYYFCNKNHPPRTGWRRRGVIYNGYGRKIWSRPISSRVWTPHICMASCSSLCSLSTYTCTPSAPPP